MRVYAGATPGTIDRSTAIAVVRTGTEATVPVPEPGQPVYFEVVPRRTKHGPVVRRPAAPLRGAPNSRDLGGYGTVDGHQVRWGRLFRTDGLGALTEADHARLAAFGLPSTCPSDDGAAGGSGAPLDAAAIRGRRREHHGPGTPQAPRRAVARTRARRAAAVRSSARCSTTAPVAGTRWC